MTGAQVSANRTGVEGRVFYLAQVNTPRLLHPLDSPEMEGFVALIEEVNLAADDSPGFVWRQEHPSPTEALTVPDDPMLIINISLWDSVESLKAYMMNQRHLNAMRQRRKWFESQTGKVTLALWWVREGQLPTIPEALGKLIHLDQHGPSEHAFDFRTADQFPKPST